MNRIAIHGAVNLSKLSREISEATGIQELALRRLWDGSRGWIECDVPEEVLRVAVEAHTPVEEEELTMRAIGAPNACNKSRSSRFRRKLLRIVTLGRMG